MPPQKKNLKINLTKEVAYKLNDCSSNKSVLLKIILNYSQFNSIRPTKHFLFQIKYGPLSHCSIYITKLQNKLMSKVSIA